MNPNAFKNRSAAGQRPSNDMVEWEELPSFSDTLSRRLVVRGSRGKPSADFQNSSVFPSDWNNTTPAALEPLFEPAPFHEAIAGLATRELHEPDVFRHFFA